MFKTRNIILLFLGVIIGTAVIAWVQTQRKILQPKNINPSPTTSPISASPSATLENPGTIEGSMGFPSETIPAEILVCVENQDTKQEYCTNDRIDDTKYTYHIGYKLDVPEGKYLVYEKMPGIDYRAYYSEFVTCGISVNCPSHEPIIVEVKTGETIDKVDPQDWYNQPTPTP